MYRNIKSGIIIAIFLLVLVTFRVYSQDSFNQSLRLMFYNVENLFDITDDTLKNDDEFLPGGVLRWNYSRYKNKISSIYKVITAAGEWSPPAVVALCEVENRKVLEDLVYGTNLLKSNYGIIHEESPDLRGIDVCLIYRPDIVKVIDYSYWTPVVSGFESFSSRSILYSRLLAGRDTIHLIVNHWPSRRGGVLAGEFLRTIIAEMVMEKADSIMRHHPAGAAIVILGDFNCTPADQEIKVLTKKPESGGSLINLTERLAGEGIGTYRYMGIWEMIDQVIVSESLLLNKCGPYTEEKLVAVFKPEFLLRKDPKYPGQTPFSTYRGYRYQGGFSDHLPVLLDIKFR